MGQLFLVTEPAHHRIGLYEGGSFQFVGWLGYPSKEGARRQYNYPTSVLNLDSGCVALIEKDRLHIFDREVRHLQSIRGVFHGLAEGSDGEIFTLTKNRNGEMCLEVIQGEIRFQGKVQNLWADQVESNSDFRGLATPLQNQVPCIQRWESHHHGPWPS